MDDLIDLQQKVIAKVTRELAEAYNNGELEEFKKKYGIEDDDTEHYYYNEREFKILIIGDLAVTKKVVYEIAEKYNINYKQLEFVEYSEAKRFNYKKLEGSTVYSDILVGPMGHSNNGMGDCSSFLANVEKHPEIYPKVIRLESNTQGGNLKITKTALINGLEQSRGYLDNVA